MTDTLKALGLAFVAALAISALVAQVATADELHSGSSTGNTYLTAEQAGANVIDTPAGTINCKKFSANSNTGTTATLVTISNIAYSECTAYGLDTVVNVMGCDYLFTGDTATTGIIHIICPTTAGGVKDQITVTPTAGGMMICHIDIPEQTANVALTNTAGTPSGLPDDVFLSPETVLTYDVERTPGGSKCPTNGHHNDGTYTGFITIRAFEDIAHSQPIGLTYT